MSQITVKRIAWLSVVIAIVALTGIVLIKPAKAVESKLAFVLTGQSNMVLASDKIEALIKTKYGSQTLAVKCAVGGSSILRWQKGADLYEACLQMTRAAIADGYTIEAIFLYQGERDSHDSDVGPVWKKYFYSFAKDFRWDLEGATVGKITIPVVYAQLGKYPTDRPRPYWDDIRKQQDEAVVNHPNLFLIRTWDIAPYCPASGPHFCPDGYSIIAQRFVSGYQRYLNLQK